MTSYPINLNEAIYSLSNALDLVGVTHIHHGKRVAYLATAIGQQLGWSSARLDQLFLAAMLHDCGVSRTRVHAQLHEFSWEEEQNHCDIGAAMLRSCPPLARYANIVRYHHSHWKQFPQLDASEDELQLANCIYLADRVDILSLKALENQSNVLLASEPVCQRIVEKSGDWFSPTFVDAFMAVSRTEAFWFQLDRSHVDGYATEWMRRCPKTEIDYSELRSLVHLFSRIVDAKSEFTSLHSQGVASLARHIGTLFQLPERTCELLEMAGLLHDIGKLRVPDEILEKPAPLTRDEFSVMRRHSFDTFDILKGIHGLEEVASWASQHHERLDGQGYPFHLADGALSTEARILAVADGFQALAQDRPYRASLPAEEVIQILRERAAKGELDSSIVAKVEENLTSCWNAALPYLGLAK